MKLLKNLLLVITLLVQVTYNSQAMQPESTQPDITKNIFSECLTKISKLQDTNPTDYKKEILADIEHKLQISPTNNQNHEECLKLKARIALTIFAHHKIQAEFIKKTVEENIDYSPMLGSLFKDVQKFFNKDSFNREEFLACCCGALITYCITSFLSLYLILATGEITEKITINEIKQIIGLSGIGGCLLMVPMSYHAPLIIASLIMSYKIHSDKNFVIAVFNTLNINLNDLEFLKEVSLSEIPNDHDCSICLTGKTEPIENPWVVTLCNHKFHNECINKWLDKHPVCPMCLQPANK